MSAATAKAEFRAASARAQKAINAAQDSLTKLRREWDASPRTDWGYVGSANQMACDILNAHGVTAAAK